MKGLLKSLAVVAVVIALAIVAVPAVDAAYTRDLTIGSSGSDVAELQTFLVSKGFLVMPVGVTPGYFGALTQAALARYQAANGIVPPAGYFGPLTRASVASMGSTAPVAGLPAGCSSTAGFSPTTGARCDSGSSSSGSLSGGDGDIQTIKQITTGTETTVSEGKEEKVMGLEIEADKNSDLEVSSFRLVADVDNNGSTRLNRYVEEVVVYQGSKEVGSADVSDFSRSGSEHTATVSLDNAVIKKGEKARFYVAVVAKSNIDSDDLDNTFELELDRVRYNDASGAALTENPGYTVDVAFEDASENDEVRLQSSSSNPKASTIAVEANRKSDEVKVFAFNLKGGSDSSDVSILEIPVEIDIFNPAGGVNNVNPENIIEDIWLEIDGDDYDDVDRDDVVVANSGTETSTYTFEIEEGDVVIESGDSVTVNVYVVFGKQDTRYDSNTTVRARVARADIEAENEGGDSVALGGSATVTGNEHTLVVDGVNVEYVSSSSTKVDDAGTIRDFTLVFDVTAVGDDVEVDRTVFDGVAGLEISVVGPDAASSSATLSSTASRSGDIFTVFGGSTKRFTLVVTVSNAASTGQYKIVVDTVAGSPATDVETVAATVVTP
jgi:hypothetical protein